MEGGEERCHHIIYTLQRPIVSGDKGCGLIAGRKVMQTVNVPTASAFAYGLDKGSRCEWNIRIFDMDAGV